MRRILHGDVTFAARLLLLVPPTQRQQHLEGLFAQAEAADLFRKATGHAHALWGNGSLMAAAARADLPPERGFDDGEYCQCFIMVVRQAKAFAEGRFHPLKRFSELKGFGLAEDVLNSFQRNLRRRGPCRQQIPN